MKCPACVEEGKVSRWYPPEWWSSTSMGFSTYYDEEGRYHSHDPNSSWSSASCSNGHRFFVQQGNRCSNCDYGDASKLTLYGPDGKTAAAEYQSNKDGEWEKALVEAATG